MYGAYPDADAEYPAPRSGHPKDRRPHLKQIQAGLAVAADGGIPVSRHAYDGGAGEAAQVTGAMTALKKIAGPRAFLLVRLQLISFPGMPPQSLRRALAASGAGRAVRRPPAGAGTEWTTPPAGRGKPAAARGTYRVLEDDGMDIRGPRTSDPVVHLRRILVYSPANAACQAKARALKLAKAAGELDKLVRTAGTRFHPPSVRPSHPAPPVCLRHHRRLDPCGLTGSNRAGRAALGCASRYRHGALGGDPHRV